MDTELARFKDRKNPVDPHASLAVGWRGVGLTLLSIVLLLVGGDRVWGDDRVTLPDGFQLSQVAGDQLATNIFCMIAVPDGGVLVSGPGYIKKLIDGDQNGSFDKAVLVSDFPKSGAQGMAIDGSDLLCVGDGGIWRLSGVLKLDGTKGAERPSPVRLFKISTHGEHHAHSIQRGPDGWWYHIAGNHATFDETKCGGPIKKRHAGVFMRFSPDFSQREILAHGFRNAYDFAFNSTDQLFTFDSDGERDLGLPWYRPTRVFEIVPGDDAGWVSKTWKRPSYYFDMPRVLGDAGRSSPTGVVCYDGSRFPSKYDDAIFLGDWTFGRVLVCEREWKSGKYLPPKEFLKPNDSFGFPVTDLAVASDGSLLISVGGRGTEGGVWRVNSTAKRKESEESLGQYIWEHRKVFHQSPEIKSSVETALKVLDHKDTALQVDSLASLLVHRRLLKLDRFGSDVLKVLAEASRSNDPKVLAATMRFARSLCHDNDRWKRFLVSNCESLRTNPRLFTLVTVASDPTDAERRELFDYLLSSTTFVNDVDDEKAFPDDIALRLAQLLHEGVGHTDGFFSSVVVNKPIKRSEVQTRQSQGLVFHAEIQTVNDVLELGRLLAMEQTPALLAGEYCLEVITNRTEDEYGSPAGIPSDTFGPETPASTDLHWLMCVSQFEPWDDQKFVERLANNLLSINEKFQTQGIKTDSHFRPMMDELASRFFKKYPQITKHFLAHAGFGSGSHGFLFPHFADGDVLLLQEKIVKWVQKRPSRATTDHVQVLAKKPTKKSVSLLRELAKNSSLKDRVTLSLTRCGDATDRQRFVEGLRSLDPKVQKESAIALRRLVPDVSAEAAVAALRAAMRLGNEKQDVSIRDQMILLLRKFAGKDFGYQLSKPELRQSDVLIQWRAFLIEQQPELADVLKPAETGQQQLARLEKLDWDSGDAVLGKRVYEKLQCAACHGAARALGPRLEGVTRRLGRIDLLTAIVNPDAQVSDRYRTTLFETVDGQLVSGSIVYENVDGVTIREPNGQTVRLNRDQIEAKRRSQKSLMPMGLLEQASDQEVADLVAYLKTL